MLPSLSVIDGTRPPCGGAAGIAKLDLGSVGGLREFIDNRLKTLASTSYFPAKAACLPGSRVNAQVVGMLNRPHGPGTAPQPQASSSCSSGRRALLLGGSAAAAGALAPPLLLPPPALAKRRRGEGDGEPAKLPPIPRVKLAPGLEVSQVSRGLEVSHRGRCCPGRPPPVAAPPPAPRGAGGAPPPHGGALSFCPRPTRSSRAAGSWTASTRVIPSPTAPPAARRSTTWSASCAQARGPAARWGRASLRTGIAPVSGAALFVGWRATGQRPSVP